MTSVHADPKEATVSLVYCPDAATCLGTRTAADVCAPAMLFAGGLLSLAAVAFLLASFPMLSLYSVAVTSVAMAIGVVLSSRRRSSQPAEPEDIADPRLRATYRTLLLSHAELARTLADARPPVTASSILDRSREAVRSCGQLAQSTNEAHRHLAAHSAASIATEVAVLREQSAASTDGSTTRCLAAAADARARQLDAIRELEATRDRVHARLELALATLQTVTAGLVKLHLEDSTNLVASSGSLDEVDGLEDELEALASASAACLSC